ncbi:MAG: hypothetical protein K2N63_16190, partial [Lachnospiraceae bacterium]|nr:hypothetical protein [Lachnospiraceae bacterium]
NSILVAYFSLAGEQYGVGVIEEGNTVVIAKVIAEQTGADIFEIEAVNAYPETYDGLLDVSQQEMSDNARPEIAGTVDNIGGLRYCLCRLSELACVPQFDTMHPNMTLGANFNDRNLTNSFFPELKIH